VNNSNYFHFVRGKIRALYSTDKNVKTFEKNLKNKTYVNLEGEKFALAIAYLRENRINDSEKILNDLEKKKIHWLLI
jgi:predicted Zn-dependent protease